jgi:rifampicin phosphotransferase
MTTDAERPLPLASATDPNRCGNKAATLAALAGSGHRVPDGFVIPAGVDCSFPILREGLERLGAGPYAVRSSGLAEDGADASLAGRYETVLDVDTLEDVAAAALRVRASASKDEVAVLVQRLVRADVAGVMFTANPVTGDDEIVIEAVRGLGDRLLDGAAEGDRWIAGTTEIRPILDTGVLSTASVERLIALARRIAEERGAPQDIEWAFTTNGELHLLQARPITGLPRRPEITVPPGRWMRDVSHFTGPITPIGETILLPAYERALESTFETFGLPLKTIQQRAFGGEVYTQDLDATGKHDPAAPPPWWVLALAVRLHPVLRRRMKTAQAAMPKLEDLPRRWHEQWRAECAERIERARAVELEVLDDRALLRELDRAVEEILRPHLIIHFDLTVPHVLGVHDLYECCRELLGWSSAQTFELLAGMSSATTGPTRELRELVKDLDDDLLSGRLDDLRTKPVGPRLEKWLEHWGLRTIDVDPGAPMLAEREPLVMSILRNARRSDDRDGTLEQQRRAKIAEARAKLGPEQRRRFDEALRYAEQVYGLRDDNVVYTEGLPCGVVRRILLEIGRRLAAQGVLHDAEDVAFLRHEELAPALEGTISKETPAARVQRRRAEHAWVLAHPGPLVRGPAPVPDPDPRGMPAAARRLMKAMLWAMSEELAHPEVKVRDDGALLGIGASPGRYTGPVRVIRTEKELDRLRPGDVLVCPTTHSSWTVVFGHAGALVADGGGMLSHPAIIAREHSIPAVLGTGVASTTLRDGDVVTVDGNGGFVQKIR